MAKWTETVNFRALLEVFDSGDSGENELEEIKRIKPILVERFNSIQLNL